MGISRQTSSVKIIQKSFENSNEALSVVDLVQKFSEDMNKTTVYRVLDRLEKDGKLHAFLDKDGLKWYAKCKDHCSTHNHIDLHPHFQCNECGKVECIEMEMSIPALPNRQIQQANLLFIGQCEECGV